MQATRPGMDREQDAVRQPVALPGTWQSDIADRDGTVRRLFVAVPRQPAPAHGFPLTLLVDGNALFAIAVTTAELQAGRPGVTGVGPGVVVGIGYPGDTAFSSECRSRDLLPGEGAGRFLDHIETSILPIIARLAPLAMERPAIIGHSYGGLFALHALFTRPGFFRAHVAGSPSIWWNERAILQDETMFVARTGTSDSRLLITVGSEEQPAIAPRDPRRAERLAKARMVDSAREMAARLRASGKLECDFTLFAGENHASVIPAMLSRAIAFAFRASDKAVLP